MLELPQRRTTGPGLTQQRCVSLRSRGWTSKIKVSTKLVSFKSCDIFACIHVDCMWLSFIHFNCYMNKSQFFLISLLFVSLFFNVTNDLARRFLCWQGSLAPLHVDLDGGAWVRVQEHLHFYGYCQTFLKSGSTTLAGVARLTGISSHNLKVAGLIPSQDTYLGCGFNPQSRSIQEITNQCFSLT